MPSTPTSSDSAAHLLVPFASASDPACRAALSALQLPRLSELLALLEPAHEDIGDEHSLSPPHERARARAMGLQSPDGKPFGDGHIPWAAAASAQPAQPQAWFTPCHFQVGMEQVTLLPGDQLGLDDEHARPLFDALAPYCAEDGITLTYTSPTRWHAQGEPLRDLPCASLDRVAGRSVQAWMGEDLARTPGGQLLKRLQSEAQMLFYTHPVHDVRTAARLHPVNGFWVSGAGALDHPVSLMEAPTTPDALRQAALQADWSAWQQAWAALDQGDMAHLLARAQRGEPVTLTLCGERAARQFVRAPHGRFSLARMMHKLRGTPPAWKVLETL
jgi:hypothetical protein